MAVESSSCRAVTFWEVSSIRGYYNFWRESKSKYNRSDLLYLAKGRTSGADQVPCTTSRWRHVHTMNIDEILNCQSQIQFFCPCLSAPERHAVVRTGWDRFRCFPCERCFSVHVLYEQTGPGTIFAWSMSANVYISDGVASGRVPTADATGLL